MGILAAFVIAQTLAEIFARLDSVYDYAGWHWQPATPADEICIGAILVQHTNWANVEQALVRLRDAGALALDALGRLPEETLTDLVRPSGTPSVKARRLRALAALAADHGGIDALLALPTPALRPLLLATHGIGPETADTIMLYAAGKPVFEIDAYTERIFRRLGLGPDRKGYHAWQCWFESVLAPDVDTYRRYHALVVLHGKSTCRPRPRCDGCCLLELCPAGRKSVADG